MVTLTEKMEESSNSENGIKDCENVKVVVRVRPLNDKEMSADYRNIVNVDAINGTVKLAQLNQSRESPPKVFTFDTVFPHDVKQVINTNQLITIMESRIERDMMVLKECPLNQDGFFM